MSVRTGFVVLCVFAIGVVLAQNKTQGQHFKDLAGNFRVDGILSSEISGSPAEGDIHFEFTGKPLQGFSKTQGLEFRAQSAKGDLKTAEKSFVIQQATLAGDVWLKVNKEATKDKAANEIVVTSAQVKIVDGATEATVTSPSRLELVSSTLGDNTRKVTLTGPNAKATLDPLNKPSEDPLRTVVMTGRVTVVVDSFSKDKEGRERKTYITATGDRLDYDRATREVVLTGNVKMSGRSTEPKATGGETGFEGDLSGERFTVRLDKKNEVLGWTFGQGKGGFREGG
ncbi:MAG: hypothetical protein JSS65_04480 [Armatimonadetes bacterium]|nr:hypothetical protein [Armatimonadota bacterium]